jgi:hypothetical protein
MLNPVKTGMRLMPKPEKAKPERKQAKTRCKRARKGGMGFKGFRGSIPFQI